MSPPAYRAMPSSVRIFADFGNTVEACARTAMAGAKVWCSTSSRASAMRYCSRSGASRTASWYAFVAAAKAYQEAVRLAPDREQYRIALALELVEHQTFAPAIAVLAQASTVFPKSAKIRTLLGIARYAGGDIQTAITELTDAIEIDPKLEPAHIYLARIVLDSSAAPPQRTVDSL